VPSYFGSGLPRPAISQSAPEPPPNSPIVKILIVIL
jgi:hypothetical protein